MQSYNGGSAPASFSPPRSLFSLPSVKTSNAELHYERAGSGEPLLLIQGMSGTHLSWGEPFLTELERDFDLVAYDHRGVGRSSAVTVQNVQDWVTPIRDKALALLAAADLKAAGPLAGEIRGLADLAYNGVGLDADGQPVPKPGSGGALTCRPRRI